MIEYEGSEKIYKRTVKGTEPTTAGLPNSGATARTHSTSCVCMSMYSTKKLKVFSICTFFAFRIYVNIQFLQNFRKALDLKPEYSILSRLRSWKCLRRKNLPEAVKLPVVKKEQLLAEVDESPKGVEKILMLADFQRG